MGRNSKDKRDIFYRKAKEDGYRARSAYKLLHIEEQFHIFDKVTRVVDLCAAPGSWSQVLAEKLPGATIVAVDLQEMAAVPGVRHFQGDITSETTSKRIVEEMEGQAQLVVCDGAPDVTGVHDMDEYVQAQLVLAALNIASVLLEAQGTFVAKIFRGREIQLLYEQLSIFFSSVSSVKPRSSRTSSLEAFVVCQGFAVPPLHPQKMIDPSFGYPYYKEEGKLSTTDRLIVPFIACGDMCGFDSDTTYETEEGKESLLPIMAPLSAPYLSMLQQRRQQSQKKK